MNTTAAKLTKAQQVFAIGAQVEIEEYDFSKPGMPLAWWPATVTAVTVANAERRLIDVQVAMNDGRPHVETVGPRGGNKKIRVAA